MMKTYIQANKVARKAIQTAQAIRKRKEETELKQKLAFEIEQRAFQRELEMKILPYVLLVQRAFRRYRRRVRSMSITRSYRLHVRDVAKQVCGNTGFVTIPLTECILCRPCSTRDTLRPLRAIAYRSS